MDTISNIIKKLLTLKPAQKAKIIDNLLKSLDSPDKDIDELWAKEAEERIAAYEKGKIKAISLEEVLEKYK